jgi:hypothetical protein
MQRMVLTTLAPSRRHFLSVPGDAELEERAVSALLIGLLLCVTAFLSIVAGFCIGWMLAGRSVAQRWSREPDEPADAGS